MFLLPAPITRTIKKFNILIHLNGKFVTHICNDDAPVHSPLRLAGVWMINYETRHLMAHKICFSLLACSNDNNGRELVDVSLLESIILTFIPMFSTVKSVARSDLWRCRLTGKYSTSDLCSFNTHRTHTLKHTHTPNASAGLHANLNTSLSHYLAIMQRALVRVCLMMCV